MEKKRVIQHLIEFIQEEISELAPSEGKEDVRRRELETLLAMYRFLPSRSYAENDPIIPSSLVQVQTGNATSYLLIVPRGGGLVTQMDGIPLQVVTPQSPLGEALLGHKTGDEISVEIRGQMRAYRIVSSA